jgi:two-component system sensor histidine kinase KdpD
VRSGRIFRPRAGEERAQFLPLRVGAHSVGVLELVHKAGVAPDPERERLLATFANGAALALEQERLVEEERAADIARESDRLKSALLSSVSHDLRTPLAGIKAAASSLLQDDVQWGEEDRRAFIADIDAEADRLTRLVSNLLDLSRIEAGALRPQKDWEDVGELIGRVVQRLEPRLAGRAVELDVPDTLPPVRLDAVQMEQVLTNLLENAVKYSPPGSPIEVKAQVSPANTGVKEGPVGRPDVAPRGVAQSVSHHAPPAGTMLLISVTDHGLGIAPSEQERVFDKFYRVASTASRASGTGMGLAIVKGLVEGHGGQVTVESVPGRGSTFTVSLPIEPVEPGPGPGRPRALKPAQEALLPAPGPQPPTQSTTR